MLDDVSEPRGLPGSPPILDSHLVMNALNQIAAADFLAHGLENPLLFALSDYLQEALPVSVQPSIKLARELRLLKAYVELCAKTANAEIDVHLQSSALEQTSVRTGVLAALAAALLRGMQPAQNGRWRLTLGLAPRSNLASAFLGGQLELRGLMQGQGIDVDAVTARLPVGGVDLHTTSCQRLAVSHVRLDFFLARHAHGG